MNENKPTALRMHQPLRQHDTDADYSNPGLPQIDSNMLLGPRNRMLIRHGDKRYLLRQTRRGKLILTGHED